MDMISSMYTSWIGVLRPKPLLAAHICNKPVNSVSALVPSRAQATTSARTDDHPANQILFCVCSGWCEGRLKCGFVSRARDLRDNLIMTWGGGKMRHIYIYIYKGRVYCVRTCRHFVVALYCGNHLIVCRSSLSEGPTARLAKRYIPL